MKKYILAIEMGSSNTVIYKSGVGVILKEPTLIALENIGRHKNVVAVGLQARKLMEQSIDDYEYIFPVQNGVIVNKEYAKILLEEFFKKIDEKKLFRNNHIIFCLPCGLNTREKNDFKTIAFSLNAIRVDILPCAILTNYYYNADLLEHRLIINIGGGLTDVSIVEGTKLVTGCSINLGGNNVDDKIARYVLTERLIDITPLTTKEIKNEIATLLPNDLSEITVGGYQKNGLVYDEFTIKAQEITNIFQDYYELIAKGINDFLKTIPNAMLEVVRKNGTIICGGSSKICGLERFLKNRLNMPVIISSEPENTVILGAGKLLNNSKLLNSILKANA